MPGAARNAYGTVVCTGGASIIGGSSPEQTLLDEVHLNTPYTQSWYRWYILALITVTFIGGVAMPAMAMSVLAAEIAADLDLNVVQVGVIWGIAALPGIITGVLGGALGDRWGPHRLLLGSCLAVGVVGAARAWVSSYGVLVLLVTLLGALTPFITINGLKLGGQWFPPEQLGLANGIISMGMGGGFFLGALVSATLLSPWLGGWRAVFLFYGVAALLLSLPWIFVRPARAFTAAPPMMRLSFQQSLAHVVRQRDLWLLGLGIWGIAGCVQGLLGYLPLYLRHSGWMEAHADAALSAFHLASLIAVLPIALLSDRLGSRKPVLLAACGALILGVSSLMLTRGPLIWVSVLLAGLTRDGFMAVFITRIVETENIGVLYAGTATGLVMAFSGLGSFVAPPLGNSLVRLTASAPFGFWGGLALLGALALLFTREKTSTVPLPSR